MIQIWLINKCDFIYLLIFFRYFFFLFTEKKPKDLCIMLCDVNWLIIYLIYFFVLFLKTIFEAIHRILFYYSDFFYSKYVE